MLKGNNKTVWEKRLNKVFQKRDPEEIELLINLVSLTIFSRNREDLGEMYHLLGLDGFSKIISLFSGRTVAFPDREEFRSQVLIALCYYYKELKGMDWKDIKKELPFAEEEINTIKLGKGIAKLKKEIKQQIQDIFKGVL